MPTDPEKFKHDPRTPQQLAKAILDHELTPPSIDWPSVTFREQLFMDQITSKPEHAGGMLWALKRIEEDILRTTKDKTNLDYALQAIDSHKKQAALLRDDSTREANAVDFQQNASGYGK